MEGIDTNVLLRALTDDHPVQSRQAKEFLEATELAGGRLHVTVIVLCETVWTLAGRRYGWDRRAISDALERMLSTALFDFAERDAVHAALSDYQGGSAGFADALIGHLGSHAGCDRTLTFDRALHASAQFSALPNAEGSASWVHERP